MDHFTPMNLSGESDFMAITATTTLTLFAFLGIESATIPADNIKNPTKNIPKATYIGTWVAILVYIIGSVAVMGLIAPEQLAVSEAPFCRCRRPNLGGIGQKVGGLGHYHLDLWSFKWVDYDARSNSLGCGQG